MTALLVPDDEAGLARAIDVLDGGGVVALPTDTVYGIATGLAAPGGVERLFRAKDRPPEKAIIVLVDRLDQVRDLVELGPAATALATAWPGGLTLVLRLVRPDSLPPALTAGTATLGVRVPDHPTPRALARAVGPIPTTSANRSGMPEGRSADEVSASLGDRVDLILDGGPSPGGVPSTVVDCTDDEVRVLRPGAIEANRIATILEGAGIRDRIGR